MRWQHPPRTVHEQSIERGELPPAGETAGELRARGYEIPSYIDASLEFQPDRSSPSGWTWWNPARDEPAYFTRLGDEVYWQPDGRAGGGTREP